MANGLCPLPAALCAGSGFLSGIRQMEKEKYCMGAGIVCSHGRPGGVSDGTPLSFCTLRRDRRLRWALMFLLADHLAAAKRSLVPPCGSERHRIFLPIRMQLIIALIDDGQFQRQRRIRHLSGT